MRLGIISDTHDQVARASGAVGLLIANGAEALIHCGDYTDPDAVYACAGIPGHYVFGNNDFDEGGLRAAMTAVEGICLERGGLLTLGGRRIAVTHGDSTREIRRLAALEPDYLFFGHTHQSSDHRVGPTRFINPGALYRAAILTVAVLDLDRDDLRFLVCPKE